MLLSINCKGKILPLEKPLVMGVLNVTPDSFYDGGKHQTISGIAAQATKMLHEGAAIIDIGGMSSKPGNAIIAVQEELNRILPAIETVLTIDANTIISIDTLHAAVAAKAIEYGAAIVNDISAGKYDPQMLPTVADLKTPFIAMHMQGVPENMMQHTNYNNILTEVIEYFVERINTFKQHHIADVIIDVGFGFSKTQEQNYFLLKNMHALSILEKPVLAGLSRKSMAYKLLHTSPTEALNATTALNMLALTQGAKILRVHDVKEAVETIKIWNAFNAE